MPLLARRAPPEGDDLGNVASPLAWPMPFQPQREELAVLTLRSIPVLVSL
jgi:hypothetical protein